MAMSGTYSPGTPERFTVEQCLATLVISRGHFYKRVRDGMYQITKDGRRTFMTREQLDNAILGISPGEPVEGEYWAQNDNKHIWRIGHVANNHDSGQRIVVFYSGNFVRWLLMPAFRKTFTNAALRQPWLPDKDK